MSHRFGLVVFDLGSVLVQATRTWVESAERIGLPLPPMGVDAFESRLAAFPRRSTGAIDSERYFPLFAEASDGTYTPDDARRISNASLIAEYPGISRIFDALDSAGVEAAVLSNSNDAEWPRLFPETSVEPEFPTMLRARYRFGSHLMGVLKPDQQAYREVERGTGYSGDRILFFDDREENVEAARLFGWTAEFVDYTGDTAAQILDLLRKHRVTG